MNQTIIDKWQRIFEMLLLKDTGTVTDLLPGDDPKIEMALANAGFGGLLTIVDGSEEALKNLRTILSAAQKRYSIRLARSNVLTSPIPRADYIAGNHIVDDLLSYEYCRRMGLDPRKLRIYPTFSRQVWDGIYDDTHSDLHQLPQKVLDNALQNVDRGGLVILSSYASKFEREYGFNQEIELCERIFNQLRQYGTKVHSVMDWSEFFRASLKQDSVLRDQWIALQKIA